MPEEPVVQPPSLAGILPGGDWVVAEVMPAGDVEAVLSAMLAVIAAAPMEQRLALLRAQPARVMTALEGEHALRFFLGSAAYQARFGFGFIATGEDEVAILETLEDRLRRPDAAGEVDDALADLGVILRGRLLERLAL